jgi:hypothetical protein
VEEIQSRLPVEIDSIRLKMPARSWLHRRTPEIVANLAIGWHYFLEFAIAVGALDEELAADLREDGWRALVEAGEAQGLQQNAYEPVNRFLELVGSSLASGGAHLAGPDGRVDGLAALRPVIGSTTMAVCRRSSFLQRDSDHDANSWRPR